MSNIDISLPFLEDLPLSVRNTLENTLSSVPEDMICKDSPDKQDKSCDIARIFNLHWNKSQNLRPFYKMFYDDGTYLLFA